MPTWNEILAEVDQDGSPDAPDKIRKKYLATLSTRTGRPAIGYYSGFLSARQADGSFHPECAISDLDMNGMMAVVHGCERRSGLDLLLHTPGGGIEAARGLVEYLYKMFGLDIRVIVPHMAMSSGTMIACASREILMAKHSCLGPTDPQIRGLPAMGILDEVDRAIEEIRSEPLKGIVWQQVFAKYPPAFISDCERSVQGARAMVKGWLKGNMLRSNDDPERAAEAIVEKLMDYKGTSEHGQHFLIDKCKDIGLNINSIEDDQALQEDILSVHHAYMATFAKTTAIKLIDNSSGGTWTVNN
jgi:ClpP class serine protease